MSKVFIQEDTLTNIANAIREKDGTTEPIAPQNMADAISNISTNIEPILITGNCREYFKGSGGTLLVDIAGNQITTANITEAQSMFSNNQCEEIPFEINFADNLASNFASIEMFAGCSNLKTPPKLNNYYNRNSEGMFSSCVRIREFPEDYFKDWKWSSHESSYNTPKRMFSGCRSLRKLPSSLITNFWGDFGGSYNPHYQALYGCYCLDEIKGLVVSPGTISSNIYYETFGMCERLKSLTFETNLDGTPKIAKWKSQSISLASALGYASRIADILNYNSGITADKEVKDDTTYQALKNDPDWFSCNMNYSRYNHDSAVETINSLPDTSAYLATAGGTNTITFKGASGALTDGGAINTLTEEEIAVATVKGWTVSFV